MTSWKPDIYSDKNTGFKHYYSPESIVTPDKPILEKKESEDRLDQDGEKSEYDETYYEDDTDEPDKDNEDDKDVDEYESEESDPEYYYYYYYDYQDSGIDISHERLPTPQPQTLNNSTFTEN